MLSYTNIFIDNMQIEDLNTHYAILLKNGIDIFA